ncbi:MAG TPA: hypothetical protein VEZ46_14865 [Mycobacteriales bacterium]|jgi:hypothetical protein|nr:hypothetical protein [Mycobacteriales bacterium]
MRARPASVTRTCGAGDAVDRGDIVLGWLTKVIVVMTIIGLFVVEGLSIVSARISGQDVADGVALAGSEAYSSKKSAKTALRAAQAEAVSNGAEIVPGSFLVARDGRVTVTVRQTAKTVLLYRVEQTRKWAQIDSHGNARSVVN